jgi:hypothetical protein
VRLVEGLVHFLAAGGAMADFPDHLVEHFSWPRFLSVQIWLMMLFLVYVTIHELNMLFGSLATENSTGCSSGGARPRQS